MTQIWIVFRIYQLKRNTTSLIGCFTEELDALKVACKHLQKEMNETLTDVSHCDESEYINTCLNLLKDATNTYNHHDKNSTDVEEWRKIFKNCHFNFDTCFDLRSERGLDRISTSIKIVQCPLNSVSDICISEF
jgi:hypothetical protein